jgi:hypothetical protein
VFGAELAGADDVAGADDLAEADDLAGTDDTAADVDAVPPAAAVFAVDVDGLFEADADTAMMTIAAAAMRPLSSLCRAGQDLRRRGDGGPGCGDGCWG